MEHRGYRRAGFTMLAIVLLAVTTSTVARAQLPPGTTDQIKAKLTQIEQEIGSANFNCDYKYFAQVEAAEFIFTDASGGVTTRAQDLAGEKDCRKAQGTYKLDDVRVNVYGATAVVTARATTTVSGKSGAANVRRNRFTDVFVWRDGRWQLVAGHSSRLAN